MYLFAQIPRNEMVIGRIARAAKTLGNQLLPLDVQDLPISEYGKKYLHEKIKNLGSYLDLYSYILAWALDGTNLEERAVTFLEYGGGIGLLSLLAKESNVGTVVYNDLDEANCGDAETLGKSLGDAADYYVRGDLGDVLHFLSKHGLNCDAVGSYDVIEHIHDIRGFFEKLPTVSNGHLSVSMASGANSSNPFIRIRLGKKQLELENKDLEDLRSHWTMRAEIVLRHSRSRGANLGENEMNALATLSRGMITPEIERAVDYYLVSGNLPKPPDHPTNTCNPLTGDWSEHLLNPRDLRDILSSNEFSATVMSGYFGSSFRGGTIANMLIRLLPAAQKLLLAPFYMVHGKRI